jgi:cytidylate kinase
LTKVPVITIDGPSGTGKGTMSALLAQKLGWHWLDSGSIYRAMAFVVLQAEEKSLTANRIVELVNKRTIEVGSSLENGRSKPWARVDGQALGEAIRTEACSQMASQVSAIPAIRELVLGYQRDFAKPPGLVTDGRDMGTVVFPDATLKIYLTAEPAIRAQRRQKQLQNKGFSVNFASVLEEIVKRDERDASRDIAPAVVASDAVVIDTSHLSVEEVLQRVWQILEVRGLGSP